MLPLSCSVRVCPSLAVLIALALCIKQENCINKYWQPSELLLYPEPSKQAAVIMPAFPNDHALEELVQQLLVVLITIYSPLSQAG